MDADERIGFLRRAARRAELEGNDRAARALRRMAEEAEPLVPPGPAEPTPTA